MGNMASMEHAKQIAEILALLAAGCFFTYKAITGYLRVNLSLTVGEKREALDEARDYLVIRVHLKKGSNGSLSIHDLRALVTYQGRTQDIVFPGTKRSSYRTEPNGIRRTIDWSKLSESSPLLKLVPDEEIDLCAVCEVPKNALCEIDVGLLGKRIAGSAYGQWKTSCVSLPLAARRMV
jgi:hypothetical protein